MQGRHTRAETRTRSRRGPAPWLVVLLLAAALLVFALVRTFGWLSQRKSADAIVLVNQWNSVENTGFHPKLKTVEGVRVDERLERPMTELLTAARAAGLAPVPADGYLDAEEENGDGCFRPGYSEHELGLAVHFRAADDREAELSEWLQANAWRYGFILRYPESAAEVTGIVSTEHYRFVGEAVAEQIRTMGISLEEYLDLFYGDSAEVVFEK